MIKNKKAYYEYFILEKFTAGIVLCGTEVKSIREHKISLTDSFCQFINNELFIKNMHIAEYTYGSYNNHEPKRDRKLLMHRRELTKIQNLLKTSGTTLIPLIGWFDGPYFKIQFGYAKGKKLYDKRESIKQKDLNRDTNN